MGMIIVRPSISRHKRKAPVASKRMAGAATGAVEITLPVAIVAAAYIIGQAIVDAWGD